MSHPERPVFTPREVVSELDRDIVGQVERWLARDLNYEPGTD